MKYFDLFHTFLFYFIYLFIYLFIYFLMDVDELVQILIYINCRSFVAESFQVQKMSQVTSLKKTDFNLEHLR